jgi:hypothetical protein
MQQPGVGTIVYRARLRNCTPASAMLLLVAAFGLAGAALFRHWGPAAVGAGILGSLAWVRARVRLVVTDEGFESVGPFRRATVSFAAVTRHRSVLQAGYPTNRLYGPTVHEFWVGARVTRVSFLFFPRGTEKEILARLARAAKRQ